MGMFDSIRCDVPLPDEGEALGLRDHHMQTYGLINHCDVFRITAKGRLEHLDERGWYDVVGEGSFEFGGNIGDGPWMEYRATFKEGDLVQLCRIGCYADIRWLPFWLRQCRICGLVGSQRRILDHPCPGGKMRKYVLSERPIKGRNRGCFIG